MSVEERLSRLEATNARLRAALVIVVAIAGVGALMGQGGKDEIPDVLRARAIHVIGADGEPVVSLEDSAWVIGNMMKEMGDGLADAAPQLMDVMGGSFGVISIQNSNRRTAVMIDGGGDMGAGSFMVKNGDGKALVAIRANQLSMGEIVTFDGDGNAGAKLVSYDEGGRLSLFNRSNQVVARLGADPGSGAGRLGLQDGTNNEFVTLGADPNGNGVIRVGWKNGNQLGVIGASAEPRLSQFGMFSSDGSVLVCMGEDERGGGWIATMRPTGEYLTMLGLDEDGGVIANFDSRGSIVFSLTASSLSDYASRRQLYSVSGQPEEPVAEPKE